MATIVVTGASTGIGLASVKAALAAGHRVIATARTEQDLAKLHQLGAEAFELELADEGSVAAAAEAIRANTQGKIDALFNNAGYGLQVAMEDATWPELSAQFAVNVVGTVMLTNALLDCLDGGGKLIFNSSVLGVMVVPFRGPYSMSKFALESAADAYRLELASRDIAVHVIQPGPIEADFRRNALATLRRCLGSRQTRLDYSNHINRLQAEKLTDGTLPAQAVADIVIDIVAGRKARPRYLVTRTAKVAAFLKRLLGNGFDRIASKAEPLRLNQRSS